MRAKGGYNVCCRSPPSLNLFNDLTGLPFGSSWAHGVAALAVLAFSRMVMEEIKLLAIGDLHGKSCWQVIDFSEYDKVVFMGDYVDSTSHSDEEILDNLNAVMAVKEQFPEKVVLLLGNHDIQYLYYPDYRCSGFRPSMQVNLTTFFSRYKHLFQIAYQVNNYLFSHAGLSSPWHERLVALLDKIPLGEMSARSNLAAVLNGLDQTWHRGLLHEVGIIRGGPKEFGGVTWADKEELRNHPLEGFHQVVGHNPVPYIEALSFDDDTSITFVDVLGIQEAYYEINIQWNKDVISTEGPH